ncbi:MAG: hypothetical protein AAF596_04870, partial [Planctomycetota bacterium]
MILARSKFAAVLACVAVAIGCGEPTFERDELALINQSIGPGHADQIEAMLTELFGTPDEPRLPAELAGLSGLAGLPGLIDAERLNQAAGPVASHTVGVNTGLYRRHCSR